LENNLTEKEGSRRRGFSTLELFVVIGVILILVGVVSLNATNLIAEARRDSALGQVAAVFRAARQAAQTLNEERRVVLEVTYSGDAQDQAEAYDLDPVLRYWVERKRVRTKDWDEESPDRYASPPLDDVQTLPPGITLVDINGRGLIPENLNSGESNPDGTRSLKTFVVFNSKGVVIRHYRRGDDPAVVSSSRLQSNLAMHFMFGSTTLDLTLGQPPRGTLEYTDFLNDGYTVAAPAIAGELQQWEADGFEDARFRGRPQCHTLYLLRLTGQSNEYEYGIYPPWPTSILPENLEEAI
jgi:type II secretory pathway pseudopilin PulG